MDTRKNLQSRSEMSDDDIINLFWRRDELAIKQTDHKYGKYLYTIAYNILHDRSDTEECRNDTYLGVWNAVPPDRPVQYRAYLTKIIRRISINRYKERTRLKRIPSELTFSLSELQEQSSAIPSVEEEMEIRELARLISEYLRTLSEKQRCAFICRYYFADSVADIAAMLQVTKSSVYKDLTQIRQGLWDYLRDEGVSI